MERLSLKNTLKKLEAAASQPSGLHLANTANFELVCNHLFLSSQGSHLTVTECRSNLRRRQARLPTALSLRAFI
jgi:hypothetical protein